MVPKERRGHGHVEGHLPTRVSETEIGVVEDVRHQGVTKDRESERVDDGDTVISPTTPQSCNIWV